MSKIAPHDRQLQVLERIIRQHVSTGLPVGSKAVAEELSGRVSSATVRNVMADLETAGFLEQPHVSAGRIPTDKAYRYYVDHLAGPPPLSEATQRYIAESLGAKAGSPEQLMKCISRLVAEVSHNVGLVLAPALEEKLLEHVKFIALPDRRILAVIVSKPDLIENQVIRLDEDLSQSDLEEAANYLNQEFRGWSLRTIRLEIFKRMEHTKVMCDNLLNRMATLFREGALGRDESGPLFVDGTSTILDYREFEDLGRVKELLQAVEQKAKLVKILSACLESSGRGVRIVIGEENPEREMRQCAFVIAPYRYRDRAVGVLGVLGPTRMEYDHAIRTVECVADLTSNLLSGN